MEPYDEALNFTVWGMDNERLAHDDDVSEKRRKIPQQIRDLTEGILSHERSTEFKVPERDANDELYMNVNSERTYYPYYFGPDSMDSRFVRWSSCIV